MTALLARMLGLGGPGNEIGGDEFRSVDFGAAFAALVGAIAGGRRMLLVCEDIDSLDAASREMLESALTHLAARDVMVATASRTRVRLAAASASATRMLTLTPLPEEEAARLLADIDARLAGNTGLAEAILRKAGGNPLFLKEVVPLAGAPAGIARQCRVPDPRPRRGADRRPAGAAAAAAAAAGAVVRGDRRRCAAATRGAARRRGAR